MTDAAAADAALQLLSEMHDELTNPTASVTGTEGGFEAFVAQWTERAAPLLAASGIAVKGRGAVAGDEAAQ